LIRHRRPCAIAAGLLSLAAILGLFQLKFDSEPRAIFRQSDAEFEQLEEYFDQFGADDNDVIVVLHGRNLFSPEFSSALRGFTRSAAEARGVDSVISILDVPGAGGTALMPLPDASREAFAAARSAATRHPFLAGQVVSKSGDTMLVTVVLEKDDPQTIGKLRPVFRDVRDLTSHSFSGLPVEVTFAGSIAIRIETLAGLRREFFQITALGALIALVIAIALFRSLGTTLVVAAGPATAVLWTLGLMGWAGLDIDGISTPLPSIIFVVAFANAVHLMLDIRLARREGAAPRRAARTAISHLGLACVLTSLTTAIGFGSLMLAETASVQRFGLSTAAGSFLGLLANLTVVPLLASLAKRPRRRPAPLEGDALPAGILARLATGLLRFATPIIFVALAASAILLWSASRLKSDIVWTETLPSDSEITRAMERCDEDFGGALQAFMVVTWDETREFGDPSLLGFLREIDALVAANPTFRGSLSILNFLPPTADAETSPKLLQEASALVPPAILKRVLRTDLRRTVVSMRLPNDGAAATRPALLRMRIDLASLQRQ